MQKSRNFSLAYLPWGQIPYPWTWTAIVVDWFMGARAIVVL